MKMLERLYSILRRPARDVDDELRFHLEMRVDEARRAGMNDEQARAAAMQRFGPYSTVQGELMQIDTAREHRHSRRELFDDLLRDVTFAWRSLRRAPAFAIAALVTLAIAIGANTAIYSVVHAMLLAPLPFRDSERLVIPWFGSFGELDAVRSRWHSATQLAAVRQLEANYDDGTRVEHLPAAMVSDSFFNVLGVPPLLGRTFTPEEHTPGRSSVVVLSNSLWRRLFGSDTSVVGRSIDIEGRRRTVIGVMPRQFAFPTANVAFWLPGEMPRANAASMFTTPGYAFVARLRAGVSIEAAQSELTSVFDRQIRKLNPVWDPGPTYTQGLVVTPIRDAIVGDTKPILRIVMGCAILVLLIACINVANLLLARATARQRELTVRAALGSGRRRLVRQLLTESLMLSTLGALFGVALAATSIRWLVSTVPGDIPGREDITISGPVLGFALAIAIVTGLAFGVLPALRATRAGSTDGLVRSGRGGRGPGHQRVTALLVAGEIALAVLVVTSAELLVRSFGELRRLDPGFHAAHVATVRVTPTVIPYGDPARSEALFGGVVARLSAMPGVRSVAVVNGLPLARPAGGVALRVEGTFEDASKRLPFVRHLQVVSPAYFNVLEIPLRKGRGFESSDTRSSTPVAIIDEDVARALWPGQDPIGKRIAYPYPSPWITVVGIVANVKADNVRDSTVSAIYIPFLQRPLDPAGKARTDYTVIAKTSGDPMAAGQSIREIIRTTDRSIPTTAVQTMDDVVRESVGNARFTMSLVSAFAFVALFLGAVGIYGVMSYLVGQRAQELSVRAALGATSSELQGLVLRRAVLLAVGGALAGIALALVATRPLRSVLYGVSTFDPFTLATVPILFLIVAVAASLGPARRASRSSPASVLRMD